MILSESTMMAMSKPIIAGGSAAVLGHFLTNGYMRDHALFGACVAVGTFASDIVGKHVIPNHAGKTLEVRAMEVALTYGLTQGAIYVSQSFGYRSPLQTAGIIVASEMISDYVDGILFNKSLV